MNSPLLNGSCQSRHVKYHINALRVFRLRNSSTFLTLLVIFVLSSLCFLLLTDLHSRYSLEDDENQAVATNYVDETTLSTWMNSYSPKSIALDRLTQLQVTSALVSSSSNSSAKSKKIISEHFWSLVDQYPWFIKADGLRPDASLTGIYSNLAIFADEDASSDRIANQLMYIPDNYDPRGEDKVIFLQNAAFEWAPSEYTVGREQFEKDRCPVNTCAITIDPSEAANAHAVIFKNHFSSPEFKRRYDQVWILYLLESPLHTSGFRSLRNVINWTATYRQDSDIVTPYSKYFHLPGPNLPTKTTESTRRSREDALLHQLRAKSSKAPVAWFVSNCNPSNNRETYAEELSKYIKVDIFGAFYLSFENSNCKGYMTEKFFVNGLQNNVIPIVMGARKEDYIASAPTDSFIHVDDFSGPKQLAQYLHFLIQNETMYLSYFKWKLDDHWFNINTRFWCRLCAMLHSPRASSSRSYADLGSWWFTDVCQPRHQPVNYGN